MEEMPKNSNVPYVLGGFLLLIGIGCAVTDSREKKLAYFASTLGAGAIAVGFFSRTTDAERIEFLKESLPKAYHAGYKAYVDRAIVSEKEKIVMMDAKQAAEAIEISRKNRSQLNPHQVNSSNERK